MVDVPAAYGSLLASRLAEEGWKVDIEHADGADALSAALHRRGWNAVLYGGEQPGSVPARKALALVRLADPHLPFLAVSPNVRRGDLASLIRGLDDAVLVVSDPAQLSGALTKELDAARLRRRVGSAHHLLMAQQAIADHLVAGLEPADLSARVLATLGETLGWDAGTVWMPSEDRSMLQAAAVWHAADARPEVVEFAELTRGERFAAGQGVPGRVWAFRRPSWVPDVSRDARMPRASQALRAGLMTAVAFPLAVGDECAGVIEFFSRGVHEPNGEVSAMFATVGGQIAQYLERRRSESRRLDRTRGFLDAADALILVLDAAGRVLLANTRAAEAVGLAEAAILGEDWFALAVPRGGRQEARAAFEQVLAGDSGGLGHRLPSARGERRAVSWHASALDGEGGVLLLGHAESVAAVAAAG
jgi:PAS domain S-box-containing protein